jgi:hypothetical protein
MEFGDIYVFFLLLHLARAKVPTLSVSLRFCHRANENFTVLDILHAW